MTLILASSSPRRAELLRQVGLEFLVRKPPVEEDLGRGEPLTAQLKTLALRKAQAVAQQEGGGLVIGADTVVVNGSEVMGKPRSEEEAAAMLSRLSGRAHLVLTAVAVVNADNGDCLVELEETKVHFRSLDQEEIAAYVHSGEPLDKAGAYGIQGRGAVLVERIEGCYFNVVGLPIPRLAMMLKRMGCPVHVSWRKGTKK